VWQNNHKHLVDFFTKRIDGFNVQSLTSDDLALECERSGITILSDHFEKAHGGSLWVDEYPFIFLSDSLSEPEKVVTGFHEFCHLEFDPPGDIFLSTGNLWNWQKAERQANIVGVIALMPDTEVIRMTVDRMMGYYGISRELAQFRFDLMWRH